MKLHLGIWGVALTSCALLMLGACSDETGTGTSSNNSSSSSSGAGSSSSGSSGSSGMSSSSSSSGSSGMSSSSSSSSGSGGYAFCSDCTSNTTGAYSKECKMQADACIADTECQKLATCSYDTCPTTAAGGCCTLKCAETLNTPMASQTKFFAMDNCVFCTTCKTLCDPEATEYCKVTAMGAGAMCP